MRAERRIGVCHGAKPQGGSIYFALILAAGLLAAAPVFVPWRGPAPLAGGTAPKITTRLRLTWGQGDAKTWRVIVRVNAGRLSDAQPLGMNPDTPGSLVERDQEIRSMAPLPTDLGGVDFTVEAAADARVSIEVYAEEHPERRFMRSLQLQQLRNDPFQAPIDEHDNVMQLGRAPGDRIQVDIHRPHVIFRPNEPWTLTIKPHWTPHSSRSVRCLARLSPARSSQAVTLQQQWDVILDENGSAAAWEWNLAAPSEEGVYDLTLELEPRWYQASWNQPRVLRKVQIVVVDPQLPAQRSAPSWQTVSVLEPSDRSRPARLLPKPIWQTTSPREPQWSSASAIVEAGGQRRLQLPPGGWYAVPLTTNSPQTPHRITVHFDVDTDFALAAGIWQEPPAGGVIAPIGNDWGTLLNRRDLLASGLHVDRAKRHVLTFWPGSQPAWLVLQNRHTDQSIAIGQIELAVPELSAPSSEALPPIHQVASHDVSARNSVEGRKRLAFLEWPSFIDQFNVERPLDEESGQAIEDWLTFYQGAQRLIDYLHEHDYQGLVLGAYVDGGSLFPSQALQPTPRWDSGMLATSGLDPVRKDVLKLLFYLFDREGLTLVPSFSFSGPIASLESASHQGHSVSHLRDERGEVVRPGQPLPWYDPLAADVQKAITTIVSDVAARYGAHRSFGGCSLVGRRETATMLPGRRWGFNEQVLEDFKRGFLEEWQRGESATQPTAEQYREAWSQYRCRRIGSWYHQLAAEIQRHRNDAMLYLSTVEVHRFNDLAHSLVPSLHWPTSSLPAMRDMGWDPTTWNHPGIIALRGFTIAPQETLAGARYDLALRLSPSLQEFWGRVATPGELIFHRGEWLDQRNVDWQGWWDRSNEAFRWQQWNPHGQVAQQRYATSLAQRDTLVLVEGGALLPDGDRASLVEWSRRFSKLPAVAYETVPTAHGSGHRNPVVVRQQRVGGQWYAYVVNATPWPASVRLYWEPPAPFSVALQHGDPLPVIQQADRATTVIEVDPFGLVGLVSSEPRARLIDYEFSFPETAFEQLRKLLHAMQNRLFSGGRAEPIPDLDEQVFSRITSLTPGWSLDPRWHHQVALRATAPTTVSVGDTSEPATSQRALWMKSTGDVIWIRSPPLAAPETGRLSVVVPVRVDDAAQQPTLRVSVESTGAHGSYYRFGVVGGTDAAPAGQLATGWKQYVVHFDDVPAEAGTTVQIGFDLMSAGEVWIGDFRLYDRWLDESDTKAMAQLLAGASALIESAQTIDQSRRMAESYWPQFLDHWVGTPRRAGPVGQMVDQSAVEESSTVEEESSIFPWRRGPRRPQRIFPFR